MSAKPVKEKSAWNQYITLIFFLLIGVVCGLLMVAYMKTSDTEKTLGEEIATLFILFIGMYVASMLQIVIHETGHLIFGLLTGYKFVSIRFASFMLIKQNGKLKFKRFSLAGTGGQCLMSPPGISPRKTPAVLYNLGGSLLNALTGLFFLAIYFFIGRLTLLSVLLLMMSAVGFIFAVMNGIPMRMGMVDNDGYNALTLSKNPEAKRAFLLQMKIAAQNANGIRLKDMPEEWFAFPSDEAMSNSMISTIGVLSCNRLMDKRNFEEADRLMEHILKIDSAMVDLHRCLIICDRVCCGAIMGKSKESLDKMLTKEQKKFMKAMRRFPSVIRTEYIYSLLAEKNHAKARKLRAEFGSMTRSYPYASEIAAERELMELARAEDLDIPAPETDLIA